MKIFFKTEQWEIFFFLIVSFPTKICTLFSATLSCFAIISRLFLSLNISLSSCLLSFSFKVFCGLSLLLESPFDILFTQLNHPWSTMVFLVFFPAHVLFLTVPRGLRFEIYVSFYSAQNLTSAALFEFRLICALIIYFLALMQKSLSSFTIYGFIFANTSPFRQKLFCIFS